MQHWNYVLNTELRELMEEETLKKTGLAASSDYSRESICVMKEKICTRSSSKIVQMIIKTSISHGG